jgi:hypothetical protein
MPYQGKTAEIASVSLDAASFCLTRTSDCTRCMSLMPCFKFEILLAGIGGAPTVIGGGGALSVLQAEP